MQSIKENQYITGSCVINNNRVFKDDKLMFENPGTGVSDFLQSLYLKLEPKYSRFYKMDQLCKLGFLSTELLLKGKQLLSHYKPEEVGMVLSNSSSSLDTDIRYFESTKQMASPALFVYTLPNIVIGEICIRHTFKGEHAFFIFPEFDFDFIQHYVSDLFNSKLISACICGWVECLDEAYKSVLLLVERAAGTNHEKFTSENIQKIYQLANG